MDKKEFVKPEIKSVSFLQKSLVRWTLVGLGAFLIGGLLIFFTIYNPLRQKLELANTNLEHANETIITQADQITTLQAENDILQKDLEATTLHRDVLEALSGVRGASLAVAAEDYAGARLLLIQASEALDSLSGRLGADQKDIFSAMQQSAAQILDSMQNDLNSAQPELDQLVNNLVQLEDNLFPTR